MRRAVAIAIVVCAALVAGCAQELDVRPWAYPDCPPQSGSAQSGSAQSEAAQSAGTPSEAPLAIVLGVRQNSPTPRLPEGIEQLIAGAADAERPIVLVGVDGAPKTTDLRFQCPGCNATSRRHEITEFVDAVVDQLRAVRAEAPEADPLTALSLAGRSVGDGGTVVMLDSGLQTTDPMDFTTPGMLDADPTELADYLEEIDLLPDLSGRAVVFGGLGEVAEPQPALAGARAGLIDIWREIADRGGAACTHVIEQPNTNPVHDDLPSVAVVEVPEVETPVIEPPPEPEEEQTCTQTVLRDAGDVKFESDRSTFRDPAAARAHLRDLAEQMRDEGLRADLMGTTSSWGTEEGRLRLSGLRAQAVADVLVELGVDADTLSTTGVGTNWDGHIDDRGPSNELLPGPAARNRAVVIRVGC